MRQGSADDGVKLDFGLYSSALTDNFRKAWPYDFGLVYSVTLSKEGLQTVVNVRNEGSEGFEFQVLLHTYLRVKVGCNGPWGIERLLMVSIGHLKSSGQWIGKCNVH